MQMKKTKHVKKSCSFIKGLHIFIPFSNLKGCKSNSCTYTAAKKKHNASDIGQIAPRKPNALNARKNDLIFFQLLSKYKIR